MTKEDLSLAQKSALSVALASARVETLAAWLAASVTTEEAN